MDADRSAYEQLRLKNVAINTQKLHSLGISKPFKPSARQSPSPRAKNRIKDARPTRVRQSLRVRSQPAHVSAAAQRCLMLC
jgi:hypothetical protein